MQLCILSNNRDRQFKLLCEGRISLLTLNICAITNILLDREHNAQLLVLNRLHAPVTTMPRRLSILHSELVCTTSYFFAPSNTRLFCKTSLAVENRRLATQIWAYSRLVLTVLCVLPRAMYLWKNISHYT